VLVERGVLELDSALAEHWPEFAANGRERVILRMVLSHRPGVVCTDHDPVTVESLPSTAHLGPPQRFRTNLPS
jgi:CubicO group peptidase (beta-lactamase class C family)